MSYLWEDIADEKEVDHSKEFSGFSKFTNKIRDIIRVGTKSMTSSPAIWTLFEINTAVYRRGNKVTFDKRLPLRTQDYVLITKKSETTHSRNMKHSFFLIFVFNLASAFPSVPKHSGFPVIHCNDSQDCQSIPQSQCVQSKVI